MNCSNPRTARIEPQCTNGPGPRLLHSSVVADARVLNRGDETLGTITDILLDVAIGRIAYAIVASGGFMGMAEQLLIVPWSVLIFDEPRQCFVLQADAVTIHGALLPAKAQCPETPDQAWHDLQHARYRAKPYWE